MEKLEGTIYEVVTGFWDGAMMIITILLGLRIVFKLLAAGASAPIVAWIYHIDAQLMTLFIGMFPDISLGGGSVLDIVALVTLFFYAMVFFLMRSLLEIAAGQETWGIFRRVHNSGSHTHVVAES